MSCKDCVFCKKALISDYVKDAEFYKCDMDGEIILDPFYEGDGCAWHKSIWKIKEGPIQKLKRLGRRRRR